MQTKPFHFQMAVKTVEDVKDDGSVVISGFASTPDVDRYKDIVEPEAFKDALEMFMKNPVLLRSHDAARPVGSVTSAVVTDKGLKITATVIDKQTAEEIRDGRMRALSIGYIPHVVVLMVQEDDGSLREFNQKTDSVFDPQTVHVIKQLDLVEISVVATPANGNALFTVEKSIKKAVNTIVCKSFGMSVKDADNDEDSMDKKDKDKEEEVLEENETKENEDEEEKDVDAAEGDDESTEESETSEETDVEEAENSDEDSEADDAEGEAEEKSTDEAEEADADAEPQTDEDDDDSEAEDAEEEEEEDEEEEGEEDEESDEEDTEEKAVVVSSKDFKSLGAVAQLGLIREADGDEKVADMSKAAKSVILALAQKTETLVDKLDQFSEKKPLAVHGQLKDGEEDEGNDSKSGKTKKKLTYGRSKKVSPQFAGLFGQLN